jgi:hypothetical protein
VPAMDPDPKASDIARSTSRSFLNEPQRRHFEVFLAMLEDALIEIEYFGKPSAEPGPDRLTVYDADLPSGFTESARPLFESLREEMAALADSLGIRQQHRSTKRTVNAILTAELVRLDDSYVDKLRGYGAVNPRAKTAINPVLDEIKFSLITLLASLESSDPKHGKRD